jgi:hypothetical protein
MKILRRAHLLLGCLFAPLLLYYCISGASQLMGFTYNWKDGENQNKAFLEFSSPHRSAIMPGASGSDKNKTNVSNRSESFKYFAVAMSLGIAATLVLGVIMAYRFFRPMWVVTLILVAGFLVPIFMLWASVKEWNWEKQEIEKIDKSNQTIQPTR